MAHTCENENCGMTAGIKRSFRNKETGNVEVRYFCNYPCLNDFSGLNPQLEIVKEQQAG